MLTLPSAPFRQPMSIHGHVCTVAGQPIPFASVTAHPLNESFGGWGPDVTRTDRFGAYRIELTYQGPESVSAQTQAYPVVSPERLNFNVHREPVTELGYTPGQGSNQLDFYLPTPPAAGAGVAGEPSRIPTPGARE